MHSRSSRQLLFGKITSSLITTFHSRVVGPVPSERDNNSERCAKVSAEPRNAARRMRGRFRAESLRGAELREEVTATFSARVQFRVRVLVTRARARVDHSTTFCGSSELARGFPLRRIRFNNGATPRLSYNAALRSENPPRDLWASLMPLFMNFTHRRSDIVKIILYWARERRDDFSAYCR